VSRAGPGGDGSLLGRIIDLFLVGSLPGILIALSLVGGAVGLLLTPREEEPQIVVPMADVWIEAPGLPVAEVERQISTRLEKLLAQIDGVEYVYSISHPGRAVVTVRFYVGEDREDSLVKLYNKLESNRDVTPPSVTGWVVKPLEIDDVPILVATLWSERAAEIDDYALRRIAEEVEIELQTVPRTNRTQVFGGRPRAVRVELRPESLIARQTSALEVAWALGVSNVRGGAGGFDRADRVLAVDAGEHVADVDALRSLPINVVDGIPVLLRDVAEVRDGPDEASAYTWFGLGPAEGDHPDLVSLHPAVHVSVAKQKGANAVSVARALEEKLRELEADVIPDGVHVRITRNFGETANDKVNELVEGLVVALIIVIALFAGSLGWREGLVVAVAVPITFSLVLLVNYFAGYTINRVTLFALILALGLVVDDPVVDVENIHRHYAMRREPPLAAIRTAVNEVRPPILYATLAVIISFLPMIFITGMMGPYMRPMAVNVPLAMAMSMVVAFTITPWLAHHVLARPTGPHAESEPPPEASPTYRFYQRVLGPLLDQRRLAKRFLLGTAALFVAALLLAVVRAVPFKMLPFDNKNEFQVMIDAGEGTTLERTDAAARRLAEVLRRAPEVRDVSLFVGVAGPIDFNGLARHYFLRQGASLAEIRVNLAPKRERAMQSHEIALRLRPALEAAARESGVRIAIVEVPPGPPVISTIAVELVGAPQTPYERLREGARAVEARLRAEPLISDVDASVEAEAERLVFVTDKEKAALSGISTEDVTKTVQIALGGLDASTLHAPGEVNPLPIRLRVARADRSGEEALRALAVKGRPGIAKVREKGGTRDAPAPLVRLGEIGAFERRPLEKAVYHKNLERVAYVYAEPVGRAPAEVIVDVGADLGRPAGEGEPAPRPLGRRTYVSNGGGLPWSLPAGVEAVWNGEGEWKVTLDAFRDLGIAFAVALVGIYALLVWQTASYAMPLVLMISIPLTLIGILPGFWLLDLLGGGAIEGFPNPTFFTATAMIGMIALAGIAVRNAILLIEFVHVALEAGQPLREALLRAGAVRTRAILLTAGGAMLAAIPITLDPIFSGLAWALIFGLLVSTAFTLVVIPVVYDLVYRSRPGHGLRPREEESE
jgi:multidrug efflux pump subunit AcrB